MSSDSDNVEDTNKLVQQEVGAALAALENSNETGNSEIKTQEPIKEAVTALEIAAQQEANQQKSVAETKRLALMNDAAQLEQRLNSEPTEIIEVIIPESESITAIMPIQAVTAKSQRIVAESANNTANLTVNIGIWLLSILIILVTIFWILRKSIKHSRTAPIDADMRAEIPQSPYKRPVTPRNTRTRTPSNRKAKVDPNLVDFDLGKQTKHPTTKKDDLTDFKLDD